MDELHYFAYGSNMHPLRFSERVPSARIIGTSTLPGYDLKFHKRGNDGSAKCNALYTAQQAHVVHGVVYAMAQDDKPNLDQIESLGAGYRQTSLVLGVAGREFPCFFYLAEDEFIDNDVLPFDWYKQYVLEGAKYHGLPQEYLAHIVAVDVIQDSNLERLTRHLGYIEQLQANQFNGSTGT